VLHWLYSLSAEFTITQGKLYVGWPRSLPQGH
jgi:hypothetical protein